LKIKGLAHTQIPLVFGLTVGPTANPFLQLRSIVLRRKDLPVLYTPATEIIANFPSTLENSSMAS